VPGKERKSVEKLNLRQSGHHFRSNPTPTPKQKLPTNAKPTSQSFNIPTKPLTDAAMRRRVTGNNDRENSTREGKCKGSKEEFMQDDEAEPKALRCGKALA
jgi:hypothetical protein